MPRVRVNVVAMEPDDLFAKRPDDPVNQLIRQDIDHLSIDELEARISALTGEIERCRTKIQKAVNHRATAESLFKR
ncbi:DUF1192 domain-containing protein [Rhizorhabdus dicambivorans]|uniref:DUF1192 domain-containing protein n=1 Tax=Rhizorhabdus dicambivorans TaxID=1850238 RepID=A0A2A4G2J2_9SPHN|nr:DUF1192 domain-containing protein [Rhizorhabdus dicambivorans]PCE44246.1 DUF1192 domain-containing protein [Rhizorhabdus dicambivorans]